MCEFRSNLRFSNVYEQVLHLQLLLMQERRRSNDPTLYTKANMRLTISLFGSVGTKIDCSSNPLTSVEPEQLSYLNFPRISVLEKSTHHGIIGVIKPKKLRKWYQSHCHHMTNNVCMRNFQRNTLLCQLGSASRNRSAYKNEKCEQMVQINTVSDPEHLLYDELSPKLQPYCTGCVEFH
jgi:hypothetical protein